MVFRKKIGESGQTLLIVVLTMVVSLTIGLSVISRSITNVKTSTEEANSAQALAAAEAGIQRAATSCVAQENCNIASSFNNQAEFSTRVTQARTSSIPLNGGNIVPQDEGIDLWLMPHRTDGGLDTNASRWSGDLTIHWGDTTTGCGEAALEIILITGNPSTSTLSTIRSKKYTADPCSPRAGGNGFDTISSPRPVTANPHTLSGKTFQFRYVLTGVDRVADGVLVRIVPIYKNANIAVSGTNLPTQGSIITSTGTASDVQRKLNVYAGYAILPIEYFSYGILSPKSQ